MAEPIDLLSADINIRRSSGFELQLSFEAKRGEITAVFGPSGSGKSTLLKLIAGLEAESKDVSIIARCKSGNEVWSGVSTFLATHKRGIGYVSQHSNLFPHLNVLGNLQYAIDRQAQTSNITLEDVCQWLDITKLLGQTIDNLSGGELQRVAIARVLLNKPRLILMDEPLAGLDNHARQKILPYLNTVHQHLDIPMVYVSHASDEVMYLADTIVMMRDGKIVSRGPAIEQASSLAFNQYEFDQAGAILSCQFSNFDNQYKLSELSVNNQSIYVSANLSESRSTAFRLRVPAKDVSLSLSKPKQTSILNLLSAEVSEISSEPDSATALIRLDIGGQFLLARITRKSLDKLQLHIGQSVFAQIKSVSLLSESE